MATLDTPATALEGAGVPAYRAVRVERHGAVAEVVLIGPGKGNAFGPDFWREMPQLFASLDADGAIRAVVIRGEGDNFSYGLDLQAAMGEGHFTVAGENLAAERTVLYDDILRMQRSCGAVVECRKPVIAAIAGWCIGFGLDLASACDYRLCSSNVKLSLREAKMGIVADMGSLQRLPYIIGEGRLRELAFSGKDIDAAEALRIGLVNRVYDTPEALLEAARAGRGDRRQPAAGGPGRQARAQRGARPADRGGAALRSRLEQRLYAVARPRRGHGGVHAAACAGVQREIAISG